MPVVSARPWDSKREAAKANGGVWYLQNVHPRGPIASQLLATFEGRTLRLINASSPLRWDATMLGAATEYARAN